MKKKLNGPNGISIRVITSKIRKYTNFTFP